jgi:hypothetical protein
VPSWDRNSPELLVENTNVEIRASICGDHSY